MTMFTTKQKYKVRFGIKIQSSADYSLIPRAEDISEFSCEPKNNKENNVNIFQMLYKNY